MIEDATLLLLDLDIVAHILPMKDGCLLLYVFRNLALVLLFLLLDRDGSLTVTILDVGMATLLHSLDVLPLKYQDFSL